jgi:aromatic ring-opening dioxygenase catalytic subunit (LigB family)
MTTPDDAARLPTYYLSHGGGPWPWMMEGARGTFDALDASLKDMRRELREMPRAVLMVTAHWEEPVFTLSSSPRPPMVYDYYGFPREMYAIRYDAPGEPALTSRAEDLLAAGDMAVKLDPERGFDHGTFSLMQALYPEAQMPVVQLSIRADFDPDAHLEAGRLLAPLRDEGILIVGSGLSFHNLRALGHPAAQEPSQQFDRWLQQSLVDLSGEERAARLLQWEAAPSARIAQPREDHLLPLHVAAGAAGSDPGEMIYHEDHFMGIAASSFRFGAVGQSSAQP